MRFFLFALVALLMPLQMNAATARVSKRPASQKKPRVTYDPSVVNDPNTRPDLADQDVGPAVLRAQILLDRAHFSVGQIDGRLGANTERALAGFRMQRQLPEGQGIDGQVWDALNQDTAQAVVPYTVKDEDVIGPFVQLPPTMLAQAKLKFLGYASARDELAAKFHIAPALLQDLNSGKNPAAVQQQIFVPNVLTDLTAQAARIVVSKSKNTVTVLDDQGKVIAQYPCTSGSEHDPLPIGEWKITGVSYNPKFHYNPKLFWDANPKDSKATIAPGPRNPVGLVWMDLSKQHYGIHGTPDPSLIGHSQSHGCIRLTNWDALQLASMVKPGTPASLVE